MALKLNIKRASPVVDTVRIVSFMTVLTGPTIGIRVDYVRETASGEVIDRGEDTFTNDDIAAVDPEGELYAAIKGALYEMLKGRVGAGTVE